MKICLVIIIILFPLIIIGCSEKTSYSGKIINFNEGIETYKKLKTKKEVINVLGHPNYIDPIEKKYFYYSEKKISKNFFKNKIVDRTLIVFHFNSNDTIKLIDKYDLNNQNQIKFIEDKTFDVIIEQGILEKVFGGVGTETTPTDP